MHKMFALSIRTATEICRWQTSSMEGWFWCLARQPLTLHLEPLLTYEDSVLVKQTRHFDLFVFLVVLDDFTEVALTTFMIDANFTKC